METNETKIFIGDIRLTHKFLKNCVSKAYTWMTGESPSGFVPSSRQYAIPAQGFVLCADEEAKKLSFIPIQSDEEYRELKADADAGKIYDAETMLKKATSLS